MPPAPSNPRVWHLFGCERTSMMLRSDAVEAADENWAAGTPSPRAISLWRMLSVRILTDVNAGAESTSHLFSAAFCSCSCSCSMSTEEMLCSVCRLDRVDHRAAVQSRRPDTIRRGTLFDKRRQHKKTYGTRHPARCSSVHR